MKPSDCLTCYRNGFFSQRPRQGSQVNHVWNQLSPRTRSLLDLLYAFLNAPLIGAIVGATIGLAPPLHQAFFNEPQQGGFFKAWLTSCIENVGSLFAALQVVVVGVKLSKCLRKMKRGKQSGSIPWLPSIIVLLMRFVVWPCISISVIYLLTVRTNMLPYDPVLFFCMMLMPAGPPAMAISSLAETNDSSEEDKMAISKFLIVSQVSSRLSNSKRWLTTVVRLHTWSRLSYVLL